MILVKQRRRRGRTSVRPAPTAAALALLGLAAIAARVAFASRRSGAGLSSEALRERLAGATARVHWGSPPDDATLRERVEAKVFRDEHHRGRFEVRVESGTVVLHGELDSPEDIAAVDKAARSVRGVRTVTTLISTPDTTSYRHVP